MFSVLIKKYALFLFCLVAGTIAIYFLIPAAKDYQYANGKALLAFYIPLPICLFYLAFHCWRGKISGKTLVATMLLFLLLSTSFYSVLLNSYDHFPQDDASRYRIMAEHIANNNNLWGADDLVYNTTQKVYLFQPGYRYYLAGWIKIFGKETRAFQLFNMFLYLLVAGYFLILISKKNSPSKIEKGIILFVLLSSPFVTKNIMMGLMEWLCVVLFLLFVICYWQNKNLLATLSIALLPFLRQNLLLISLLIFLWMIYSNRKMARYGILYVIVLLLPLYHNLYYAGEWKFLATYYNSQGFLVLDPGNSFAIQITKTVFFKLISYSGIDFQLKNLWANAISIICIPLGTITYIFSITKLKGKNKWIYLAITLSAIVPTLILGGRAYYPRFEWVNLAIALSFFVLLQHKQGRRELSIV